MATLIQKRNALQNALNYKTEAYLRSLEPHPKLLYKITESGEIKELPILRVIYYHTDAYEHMRHNLTKKNIKALADYVENITFSPLNVRYRYDGYNSYSHAEIQNSQWLTFEKSRAEQLLESLLETSGTNE